MALCEQCGKEHDGTFGSGRFCCRSCSNKYVALHQSPEAKARKVATGKKNLRNDTQLGKPHTEETKRKISESVRKALEDSTLRYKMSISSRGRVVSPSTRRKISEALRLSHKEGRNKGWISRNIHSYAEEFWKSVLDNNSINYIQEFKVLKSSIGAPGGGCYFLDFLLEGNVDLEIDGKQHYELSRKEHDKIRDSYLESAGFKVYRIKYKDPRNSLIVKEDIDKFLSWYKEYRDVG